MFVEKLNDSASATFTYTRNERKRARCKTLLQYFVVFDVRLHLDNFANGETFWPQNFFWCNKIESLRDRDRDRDLVNFDETEIETETTKNGLETGLEISITVFYPQ